MNNSLARHIETFFARMKAGEVWTRPNVSYSRDADLNHHTSRQRRRLDVTVTLDEVFIRVESQLLLKLARSGSILFGIGVEVFPLEQLLKHPGLSDRVARSLETMSADAAAYKGIAEARFRIVELLRGRVSEAGL